MTEPHRRAGYLITLEGGEASGKTTQLERLALALRSRGLQVVTAREPGGTPLAERIRGLLLARASDMDPMTEVLLFAAARSEVYARIVGPALMADAIVLCDRFVDSSLVYQGYGLGVDLDIIRSVNRAATGGRMPDLTLVLDLPAEQAAARRIMAGREADRIEARGMGFHERVRQGFLELAAMEPWRIRVVNAERPVDDVAAAVIAAVLDFLNTRVPASGERRGRS